MGKIQPFDPEATSQLEAIVTGSVDRLGRMLQRKADRADALREVAATENDEKAFKSADALDREVSLMIEVVQNYKELIAQHQADNASAWAMIELQDKRCADLRRTASYWKAEAERQSQNFDALLEGLSFQIRSLLAKSTDGR